MFEIIIQHLGSAVKETLKKDGFFVRRRPEKHSTGWPRATVGTRRPKCPMERNLPLASLQSDDFPKGFLVVDVYHGRVILFGDTVVIISMVSQFLNVKQAVRSIFAKNFN